MKRKPPEYTLSFSSSDLARRASERRAVEVVFWGVPIVSFDAMRQAFFRDAKAKYGDIVYWSRPADWKFQITTPNASSYYVYFNFNTKGGPLVLDVPATTGAGLFGSVLDAWQVPLADVGPEGEDQGKGGKYLLVPPDSTQDIASGYIPVLFETYNGYAALRAIPASYSQADVTNALNLVKKLRIYPLAQAANPPVQSYIDMADKLFDGIVRYDESFFTSLSRMANEEPVQAHDLIPTGRLRSLEIEKNDTILKSAVAEAHQDFMEGITHLEPYWPGTHWGVIDPIGPRSGFTFRTADRFDIEERAKLYFLACAPPKKLGAATFYIAAMRDANGELLRGKNTYRLHVPPNVPAKQYWAMTVYDLATAGFIRESSRLKIDSYDEKVQKNADGSVDIYFGPAVPAGKEANWIHTEIGKPWFSFFRFYGPGKAVAEKTWQLPDIERTSK